MAESKGLNGPTVLIAVVAVAAIGWGYFQTQRANKLEASLEATQGRISKLQKMDLPVTTSFRKSLLGSGLVAMFKNNSGRTIEVAAVLSSPATGERRTANLVIPANGVETYGAEQGWPFAPGQQVVLENNGYRPIEFTVPQI